MKIENVRYRTNHPTWKHNVGSSFTQFNDRVEQSVQPKRNKFRLRWWKYAAAAASVALLLSGGYYAVYQNNEAKQGQNERMLQYSLIAENERAQFVLPDGSKVWLNKETSLTYTGAFDDKVREVELIGEAYFEIEKNDQKPFIINVEGANIQVLGTIFNVRAYPEENEVVTTLAEGSVKFSKTQTDAASTVLEPGQQLLFSVDNKEVVVRQVNSSQYTSWKDGRLIFRQTPVIEAFVAIERAYDIKIVVGCDRLDNRKITGRFNLDGKPEDILSIMQETLQFVYEINEDTIFIK